MSVSANYPPSLLYVDLFYIFKLCTFVKHTSDISFWACRSVWLSTCSFLTLIMLCIGLYFLVFKPFYELWNIIVSQESRYCCFCTVSLRWFIFHFMEIICCSQIYTCLGGNNVSFRKLFLYGLPKYWKRILTMSL